MGGSVRLTADGLAGPSAAVRVFNITVKSGGTAAVVAVLNGSGGSEFDQIDGTISKCVVRDYGASGRVLPSGCYIDLDSNTTYVVVNYEVIG